MHTSKIHNIQSLVLTWYTHHGRDLPWRHTDDLYRITVSEIMLQQTNVPKVIEKYKAFLIRFPSIEKLARARQSSVVREWHGLGYNRRALHLHKLAKTVCKEHGSTFPETAEELEKLPGIGPYTKNAILAFGRNQDVSAVDVNIERFIRRLHGYGTWRASDDPQVICASYVPVGRARDWHNAVMDIASTYCTKKSPRCMACPLRTVCASFPAPQEPVVKKKKEIGRKEGIKHVPQRIYRGRIVQALRKKSCTRKEIGEMIKKDWTQRDEMWLQGILETLEGENMIVYSRKKWRLR